MKKLKITMQVILCLLLAIVLFQIQEQDVYASDLQDYKVVHVLDGKAVEESDAYNMKSETLNLKLLDNNGKAPDMDEVDISWKSSVGEVVSVKEVETGGALEGSAVFTRRGPGYSKITVTVNKKDTDTKIDSIEFYIKIDFSIDLTDLTLIDNKYLELDKDNTYQIKLKYLDDKTVDLSSSNMDWISISPQVATVDSNTYKGLVTALKGGNTQVLITAYGFKDVAGANDIVKEFNVVVKPSFTVKVLDKTYTSEAGVNVDVPDSPESRDVPLYEFLLQTNAASSKDLQWVIKETFTGKIINIESTDKMKVDIGVNESVYISNIKAGTYDIYAFAANDKDTKSGFTYAFMRIVVPIMFHRMKSPTNSYDIVMSVNDFYNILDNSNVPGIDTFRNYDDIKKIITFNSVKGEYKAEVKGNTSVNLVYDSSKKDLYDKASTIADTTLNFTIIDDIALDKTAATIYEGSTLRIDAKVTNANLKVVWTSLDSDVAKVSYDPTNDRVGIITAGVADKEKGFSTTDIYASLVDDHGVIKKVKCTITVKKPVAKIVLSKPTIKMNVNETESLSATIVPEELTNTTKIHWRSSDDDIVKIKILNDREVNIIAGKTAGHATISAIDQDNVIVGYSHVTVEEPVVGMELSSKDIEADLSTPFIQLIAIINPDYASDKSIQWKSTNTSIVDVNNTGLVTIKGAGKASVIATSINNPLVSAICNITIHTPVMGLTMERPDLTLKVGDSTQLTYILLPVDATNKSVAWS
ncbi:MAG: hypothetical protein GX915_04455, partial [Clostridiales bacterium]|nr:hypothetical protein [Clostridiales bacterium]